MKFLIFGGTGFVGRHLTRYLQDQGNEVMSVSRSGANHSTPLDISKKEEFSKLTFVPDVIINCASIIPAKGKKSVDPQFLNELFQTNVIGATNIANWAVAHKVAKIINCSTLVVVKKPWPVPLTEDLMKLPDGFHVGYAMSKLSQEQIMNECVRNSNTNLLHVRLSAVYGKGMTKAGIIFNLLERLVRDERIELTNAKKNSLDLIHVKDVCKALLALSEKEFEDKVLNLAQGQEVTIYDLAEKLKVLTNSNSGIYDLNTGDLPSRAKIDISKLKQNVGEVQNEFFSLEQGLKEITEASRI